MKKIYDEKHRFILIKEDNFNQLKIEQSGYQEKLLCKACECKLSKWEGETKKVLVDLVKTESDFLNITYPNEKCILVGNVNHDYFKKCMLSILWRMSVSKNKLFKIYDLGPHEEKIRVILHGDVSLTTFNYPLVVQKFTIKGIHCTGLIMDITNKGRIEGKYTLQSFVVYGFLIDIIISRYRLLKEYEASFLTDQGRMILKKLDLTCFSQKHDLLNRFNDDDVKKFHE